MLGLLAQTTTYDYSSLSSNSDAATGAAGLAGLAIFGGFFLLVWLVVLVIDLIALWKIFEKAGVEGWKAIVPFYNAWTLAEIAGKPGYWGLVSLVGLIAWIPLLGQLAALAAIVVWVILALELAKKFGKDTTFAVVFLMIFSIIGLLILGFGSDKYQGKPTATKL